MTVLDVVFRLLGNDIPSLHLENIMPRQSFQSTLRLVVSSFGRPFQKRRPEPRFDETHRTLQRNTYVQHLEIPEESKVIAYVFLFLGLAMLARNRWCWVWPMLGIASGFHVLVGGWAVVAASLSWLVAEGQPSTVPA